MTVTIHKKRPDWAKPLETMIFVPFKPIRPKEQEATKQEKPVKKAKEANKR